MGAEGHGSRGAWEQRGMNMLLHFGDLAGVAYLVQVAENSLHFVPDKPTRDSSKDGQLPACESPCNHLHSCGTIGCACPLEMSHSAMKSWKGTSSCWRLVIAVL